MKLMLQGGVAPVEDTARISVWPGPVSTILRLQAPKQAPGDYVITPDQFSPWSMVEILAGRDNRPVALTDLHDSREGTVPASVHAFAEPAPAATIGWGATPDDLGIITWRPCWTQVPYTISKKVSDPIAKMDELLPGFAEHYGRRARAKQKLLMAANPLDSLSALEKQVDLLTELVLMLASGLGLAGVPWLARYQGIMDASSSVAQAGGPDNALDQVQTHKAHMRQLIAAYLADREPS